MNLLPYKPEDYSGKFSLLLSQKVLIREAWNKTNGNLDKMVILLKIKKVDLLVAIIRHFNTASLPVKPKKVTKT